MFPCQDSHPCHTKVPAWSAFPLRPSFTHAHTHIALHWYVCEPYAALQVQDLAVTTVGKSPAQFAPLFAKAKIHVVKGRGQVHGAENNIRCHSNCSKRNIVCTKLGHLNLLMHL